MFERFTAEARSTVVLSQVVARELGHNYIGTEHLLLGLVREAQRRDAVEAGSAERVLTEAFGVDLAELRAQTEALAREHTPKPVETDLSEPKFITISASRDELSALVSWFAEGNPTEPPSDEVTQLIALIAKRLED